MAKHLDPKDLVSFEELLMATSIQIDALVQLLVEEGLISEQCEKGVVSWYLTMKSIIEM